MPDVVSCVLHFNGKILLLKRSKKVGTYKGLWGGVTGFIEPGETALETAYKEILEETGITREYLKLVCRSDIVCFNDWYRNKKYIWNVHPFLFNLLKKRKIKLDWEHTDFIWIYPNHITQYDTVPKLNNIVRNLFLW